MSPEKQRIAIAEACGYQNVRLGPNHYGEPSVVADIGRGVGIVPDFLSDLNAMAEAEEVILSKDKRAEYRKKIQVIVKNAGFSETFWGHATAAQRAEAFLRCLDLWID